MVKVSKLFAKTSKPHPLDTVCQNKPYTGWVWRTIVQKDPEWILWIITESRILLPRELEEALLDKIKTVIWEHTP